MKNLFILLLCLTMFSCKTKKSSSTTDYSAQGYTKATVKKYDVDGCGFMLFLDGDKKLNPQNLEEKYKKEGTVVWIKYTVRNGVMTTCMAGTVVTLTETIAADK